MSGMQAQHRGSARDLCGPVSNATTLAAGNLNTIIPNPAKSLPCTCTWFTSTHCPQHMGARRICCPQKQGLERL
eukprot:596759-Pelagomonas_calceolata.AAC.1